MKLIFSIRQKYKQEMQFNFNTRYLLNYIFMWYIIIIEIKRVYWALYKILKEDFMEYSRIEWIKIKIK
jgi:hypothetical protein